jgi:glutamyl-tRNA synthetase
MKNLKTKAKAYALKNAIAYGGKAQKGAVISALFNEGLKKEDVKKYSREIDEIIAAVNRLSAEKQKADFEKLEKGVSRRKTREGLPELPNVKGKVRMRFAPSASGPMHIGHAMTACISFLLVQKYKGTFYVRIEDTNPDNIYPRAYKMLKEESNWLFKNKARIMIQSERMNLYYRYAEKLINKEAAYVCTCNSERFRELVSQKKECLCRKLEIKDNLERWKKMLSSDTGKGYKEGDAVLRFKTPDNAGGIKHPNPAMRDFPLARINIKKHPLQGKKYRVWPLMNLAVSVDDIELKMTHIIRAKDHRDNAKRQEMIYKALGLENKIPWNGFLGRFKFRDMELSTTKMKKEIKEGKYKGWDDPRLPTLEALKKREYKPEAFWKFAERIGFSESDKVMDKKEYFRLLDYFNKKV